MLSNTIRLRTVICSDLGQPCARVSVLSGTPTAPGADDVVASDTVGIATFPQGVAASLIHSQTPPAANGVSTGSAPGAPMTTPDASRHVPSRASNRQPSSTLNNQPWQGATSSSVSCRSDSPDRPITQRSPQSGSAAPR